MGETTIEVSRAEGVASVLLNRPEVRNALDVSSARRLAEVLRDLDGDSRVRAIVLCGRGGYFCAGADLHELARGVIYEPWAAPRGPCGDELETPTIAAVEGDACGGGLGLALRCDLRIAAENARFTVMSRRWGVPLSDGTTVRLPRLIGLGPALEMILTGRRVAAHEALRLGLVSSVVDSGSALRTAVETARRVAAFPQPALAADRLSALRQAGLPLAAALRDEVAGADRARRAEAIAGARRYEAWRGETDGE